MADMICTVDVAVIVPVNIAPLIDDTDFKSRETAVAYNAAGMDLVWNFLTPAGVLTQTAVTPTTAGVYDWQNLGDGMYGIEIPASGGGSINNDTEGCGWFSGIATGVLPWRGPVIQFSPANQVGGLVTGADRLEVGLREIESTVTAPASAVPELGLVATGTLSGTHSVNTADLGANAPSYDISGCTLLIAGRPPRVIDTYNTSTGVATFSPAMASAPVDALRYAVIGTPPASTGSLPSVNVENWKGATAAAMTGDAFARLGAPAGASVSADIATRASSTEVTAIQNNTRVVRVVPAVIERPDAGSLAVTIELLAYDEVGNMEAPDSAPTLDVVNQAQTSRNANLGSVNGSLVSTGRYRWTYTLDANHAIEQLVFAFSVVEGGATRVYGNTALVVDTTAVDFTSTDRTALNAIAAAATEARLSELDAGTAGKLAHDVGQILLTDRLTAGRAGNLDNLDDAVSTRAEAGEAAAALTTALAESYSTDGGQVTVAQALYEILGMLSEFSKSGTTITVHRRDGTTAAFTLTLDNATAPSAISRSS